MSRGDSTAHYNTLAYRLPAESGTMFSLMIRNGAGKPEQFSRQTDKRMALTHLG